MEPAPSERVRRGLRLRGTVQGVGFRPTVYQLACELTLGGLVRNDAQGLWIEIEGSPERVASFVERLPAAAPSLARVASIEAVDLRAEGSARFQVDVSAPSGEAAANIPCDTAPCAACLAECFDPADRRYRYPFASCTACGPRFTIVRALPYDRGRTTLDRFPLCARCRAEYEDPRDRRFHAEAIACPQCGPRLAWRGSDGGDRQGHDALRAAAQAIATGAIVAVKGLGGYQLAADAASEAAVARLRERKRRPHKPFAVMGLHIDDLSAVAALDPETLAALSSRARPIVLARRRAGVAVAPSVAPGLAELGVMLPSTLLHHLLLAEGPRLQVMTSGNRSEEPIARGDDEALATLSGIADGFLFHDREIHARADDSVGRVVGKAIQPIRRARGFVPDPLPLPVEGPPLLAVRGQLKATICLARGGEAVLSAHLGELDHPATRAAFEEAAAKLETLLDAKPEAIAHDLHPDYFSTDWAMRRGLPRLPVQHHHAHLAACLAEHGRTGPALGVAFDGTGCAPDGSPWGGEIMVFDLGAFRRVGHLRGLALAGGEAAIRAPWRLALAALRDAGEPDDLLARIDGRERAGVDRLLASPNLSPRATGAGRWFDAIAALCSLRDEISYEGQAAVELEAAAEGLGEPYPFALEGPEIDLRPTVRAIAADLRAKVAVPSVAGRFHGTLAAAAARACVLARKHAPGAPVALSGGCFQNRLLTEGVVARLEREGFEALVHRRVPANDGGLCFGQAAIASFLLARRP